MAFVISGELKLFCSLGIYIYYRSAHLRSVRQQIGQLVEQDLSDNSVSRLLT